MEIQNSFVLAESWVCSVLSWLLHRKQKCMCANQQRKCGHFLSNYLQLHACFIFITYMRKAVHGLHVLTNNLTSTFFSFKRGIEILSNIGNLGFLHWSGYRCIVVFRTLHAIVWSSVIQRWVQSRKSKIEGFTYTFILQHWQWRRILHMYMQSLQNILLKILSI